MSDLIIDPVLKSLIPPLSDEEFRQLEENIKNEGCRDALVIWQGTIVDGHNRYKICQEYGIKFKTEDKEFADRDEAAEWIIRNQFGRRNLSLAQRCELAMKLKPAIQKKAKENLKTSTGGNIPRPLTKSSKPEKSFNTRKELAEIAGVSEDTISKVEKIHEKGTPEQIERARKGGKGNSVNAIYNEVTGKTKPTKVKAEEPTTKQTEVEKRQGNPPDKAVPEENSEPIRRVAPDSLQAELAGIRLKREPLTKEEKARMDKSIADMRNPDRVVVTTIDDAIEELRCNLGTPLWSLENILQRHIDLLKDKENNKKIMAVLSEAVATINEWKGKYSYEKL